MTTTVILPSEFSAVPDMVGCAGLRRPDARCRHIGMGETRIFCSSQVGERCGRFRTAAEGLSSTTCHVDRKNIFVGKDYRHPLRKGSSANEFETTAD